MSVVILTVSYLKVVDNTCHWQPNRSSIFTELSSELLVYDLIDGRQILLYIESMVVFTIRIVKVNLLKIKS